MYIYIYIYIYVESCRTVESCSLCGKYEECRFCNGICVSRTAAEASCLGKYDPYYIEDYYGVEFWKRQIFCLPDNNHPNCPVDLNIQDFGDYVIHICNGRETGKGTFIPPDILCQFKVTFHTKEGSRIYLEIIRERENATELGLVFNNSNGIREMRSNRFEIKGKKYAFILRDVQEIVFYVRPVLELAQGEIVINFGYSKEGFPSYTVATILGYILFGLLWFFTCGLFIYLGVRLRRHKIRRKERNKVKDISH